MYLQVKADSLKDILINQYLLSFYNFRPILITASQILISITKVVIRDWDLQTFLNRKVCIGPVHVHWMYVNTEQMNLQGESSSGRDAAFCLNEMIWHAITLAWPIGISQHLEFVDFVAEIALYQRLNTYRYRKNNLSIHNNNCNN